MKKADEHSLIGGLPKRVLGMIYAQVGRIQEAQAVFAEGLKGYPPKLANVRLFMTAWSFKDQQLMERIAEGLNKAGLPGEPSGFYKISAENRLTGNEIRKLFFGRKVAGSNMRSGQKWWIERSGDGNATIRDGNTSDTGKSWIEEDMLCDQWDNLYESLQDCWVIYRNPEENLDRNDEFLGAPVYGIYPFSMVE
jgi:hypothetical protein